MPRPAPSAQMPSRLPSGGIDPEALVRRLDTGPPGSRDAEARDRPRPRLDFATRDPLGLRQIPVPAPALPGSPREAVAALDARLAAELGLGGAMTFASAPDAIRTTLSAVLGPGDEVLVDSGADLAMFETVRISGARLHRFPTAALDGVERRLHRLVRQPRKGRLVIVTPAVSAQGARVSELSELCHLARQHGAILVVDLAQDFGLMGQDGHGVMEIQSCLGRADLVLGCLAGAFGADGGFAAWRDPDMAAALHRPGAVAAPLPAERAPPLLAAAAMVFGPEGRRRRRRLHGLSLRLRNHLMADGLRVPGCAAPFVPVLLPWQTALPRTALLESAGPRVGLLVAPKVPLHGPRWRIELSALHGLADIDDLAELIRDVFRAFDRVPARSRVPA